MTRDAGESPDELLQLLAWWGIAGGTFAIVLLGLVGYGLMLLAGPTPSGWLASLGLFGLVLFMATPLLGLIAAHAFVVIGSLGLYRLRASAILHRRATLVLCSAGLVLGSAALSIIYLH